MQRSASVPILGVPVTFSISWICGILVLGLLGDRSSAALVGWIVVATIAVLLHELGHAMAFREFGVQSKVRFMVFGAVTMPDVEAASTLSHRQLLVVHAAGPLVGILLGGSVWIMREAFMGGSALSRSLTYDWMFVNFGWALFNLIPISSLDGGRILQHLSGSVFGRRGYNAALGLCVVASLGLGMLAFWAGDIIFGVVAIFFGVCVPVAVLFNARPTPQTGSPAAADPAGSEAR